MKKYYKGLDGLKGIGACIIAFFVHYVHFQPGNGNPFGGILTIFAEHGWLAIDCFLLMSGLAMASGYKEKISGGLISLKDYMWKRLQHLYPLFIITMCVVIGLQIVHVKVAGGMFVPWYQGFDLWHLLLNFLCMQTGWFYTGYSFNGPAWFISVIIFCYLLYYIITKLAGKSKTKYILFLGTVVIVGVMVYVQKWEYPFLNMRMYHGLVSFFLGALLYELYVRLSKRGVKALGIVSLLALVFFAALTYKYELLYYGELQLTIILILVPLIVICAVTNSVCEKVLALKPLKFLGKISFSLYLWHFPVQIAIDTVNKMFKLKLDYSTLTMWWIYIAVALIVATLSTYFIEPLGTKALNKIRDYMFVEKESVEG